MSHLHRTYSGATGAKTILKFMLNGLTAHRRLTALVLTGLFSLVTSGCGSSDAGRVPISPSVLPVHVVTLSPVSSVKQHREYTGTIAASRRSQLAFERSARLVEVLFDEGQAVKENEVLARIDSRQLKTRVTELEARLRQQNAVLSELQAGPRTETIAATEAELAALSADVELRKATLKRSENLYQRNATSAQALDEVRLNYKAAVARANALQRQLQELQAGTRAEQIEAQTAMVAATKAQLDTLNIDIADSELKAPFAGTVVRRMHDEGDLLAPQQAVFEILETARLEARIGVPTKLIAALKESEYFVLTSKTGEFTGRLRDIVPQIDPVTRTQMVVLSVDDPPVATVADGQLVKLRLEETVTTQGFRIPVRALSNGSRGLWNVFVVAPGLDDDRKGTAQTRAVEVIHSDGEWAIVRGAIYKDELIIADGIHRIVPGQSVAIAAAETTEKG